MRKGCLKNTITYTIIVLSRKIFKEISEVLCNRYMMSGNQILVKSASNINSHIIFAVHQQKIILGLGKSCFGCFCSNEQEIF